MQKFLCTLLALIVIFIGLVGCNSTADNESDVSGTSSGSESETDNSLPAFPFDEPIELPMDWWDEEAEKEAENAQNNSTAEDSANTGDTATQNNGTTLPNDEW